MSEKPALYLQRGSSFQAPTQPLQSGTFTHPHERMHRADSEPCKIEKTCKKHGFNMKNRLK